jgi:predicted DNA-binding transcriptional regulator YafY
MPYIITKPIHGSQRNRRQAEGIIELELIPNREFYQRLLSFGGDIEILSPDSVREEMAKKAEELYNLYKK